MKVDGRMLALADAAAYGPSPEQVWSPEGQPTSMAAKRQMDRKAEDDKRERELDAWMDRALRVKKPVDPMDVHEV